MVMSGSPVGVGALVDVDVGAGLALLVGLGVEEELDLVRVSLWGQRRQRQKGSRMLCPKHDAASYGNGNDGDEDQSCQKKEPSLGYATDPALSHGFIII